MEESGYEMWGRGLRMMRLCIREVSEEHEFHKIGRNSLQRGNSGLRHSSCHKSSYVCSDLCLVEVVDGAAKVN